MSNTNKQLATELLINELERRMYIIQAETTELREQMIIDLVKDLSSYVDDEKQNIIDAFDKGYEEPFSDDDNTYSKGTEYFYETYKKAQL